MEAILITQEETAQLIGVSVQTLRRWVDSGCPCVTLNPAARGHGVRRRYDLQEVRAWLRERARKETRA